MLTLTSDYKIYLKEIADLEKEELTGTLTNIDNCKCIVALDNNEFLGYICYSLCIDEADIISLCIKKEQRRKGIASLLIKEVLKSVDSCFLDVKETNLSAIMLYEKMGFKEYYRRKNYYQDGSTAILMKWSR